MSATAATAPMKTYRGTCACGSFQFAVTMPELQQVIACNCSYCSRTGSLLASLRAPGTTLQMTRGREEEMGRYEFGSRRVDIRLCSSCGVAMMVRVGGQPYLLNVRTLESVDTGYLSIVRHDGAGRSPAYQQPVYAGPPLPLTPHREARKVMTGSCHCGAVTLAVRSPPAHALKVSACDCNTCSRKGYLYADVKRHDLSVHVDSARPNAFGARTLGPAGHQHQFCRLCGVAICALPDAGASSTVRVNLRVLQGVPLEEMQALPASCGMARANL